MHSPVGLHSGFVFRNDVLIFTAHSVVYHHALIVNEIRAVSLLHLLVLLCLTFSL